MFESGEVLMPVDIGSLSLTLFSFNLSLEMGKYDVMPWIVGLFTIFLVLIRFSIAFSMNLKLALFEWFLWINSVIDLLSGRFLLFLISAIVEINERIYVGGVYTRITYWGRIFEEAYFRDVNWVTYLGGISGW